MNLPTEVRYRPYTDWTDGEKTKIRGECWQITLACKLPY